MFSFECSLYVLGWNIGIALEDVLSWVNSSVSYSNGSAWKKRKRRHIVIVTTVLLWCVGDCYPTKGFFLWLEQSYVQ